MKASFCEHWIDHTNSHDLNYIVWSWRRDITDIRKLLRYKNSFLTLILFLYIRCEISRASFEKQPPANLRKSNFFNFVVALYDQDDNAIEVEKGKFAGFIERSSFYDPKNGIIYRLQLRFANGMNCV